MPDALLEIAENAFYGCKRLERLRIMDGVKSIGAGAFSGCGALTLVVQDGSYAQQYAMDEGVPYETAE